MSKKFEVILFSGFLGVGKTTLLGRLLPDLAKNRRLALLVNDFGAMSLDGALLKKYQVPTKEIAGGSIFCVCKQANLIQQLSEIANEIKPELLLIEASGIAEPTDTAALLQNTFLRDVYSLPKVITIVDTLNYFKLCNTLRVIDMQIKIADVIIVSKIDLADSEKLIEKLKTINGSAQIIQSDLHNLYGKIEFNHFDDVENEASLRLCATATPGFSTVNWSDTSGNLTIDKLNGLLDEYGSKLLRAKGILNDCHLELVNGEYTWTQDVPLDSKNGMFFALKDNLNKEFNQKLKELTK